MGIRKFSAGSQGKVRNATMILHDASFACLRPVWYAAFLPDSNGPSFALHRDPIIDLVITTA